MKPLFQMPRHELFWPSLWLSLYGLFVGGVAIFSLVRGAGVEWLSVYLLIMGGAALILGIGVWQEIRPMIWMALGYATILGVLQLLRLIGDPQWRYFAYAAGFGSIVWGCWDGLRLQDREYRGNVDDELDQAFGADSARADHQSEDESDEDETPVLSIVLLQSTHKYLEAPVLARIAEDAWDEPFSFGEDLDDDDLDDEDEAEDGDTRGFVVGESPMFIARSRGEMYLIHNRDATYWDDTEAVADSVGELRLAKAVRDHAAWLSVDALDPANTDRERFYAKIVKLVVQLADEDTLAIYCPETNAVNVWSDELQERLQQPDGVSQLGRFDNAPVVPISGDHPAMVAAVAEARDTLPDFVAAFEGRHEGESRENFCVKVKMTVDEETEYIWLDVLGFEPRYVHGVLGNDPVNLGELKLGDQVEVPREDIQDWAYAENGDMKGMFTVDAIRQIQAEHQEDG